MENKLTQFHLDFKQVIHDEDYERFDELIKQRAVYLEGIKGTEEKKHALMYFIETDKELYQLLGNKKEGLKQFLLTQNNQLKAIKKYEGF